MRIEMNYDSDEKLFDSISNLLLGMNIDQWDDSTIPEFYRKIHTVVNLMESIAINFAEGHGDEEITRRISLLVKYKINNICRKLKKVVGKDTAKGIIIDVVDEFNKSYGDLANGNDAGCA